MNKRAVANQKVLLARANRLGGLRVILHFFLTGMAEIDNHARRENFPSPQKFPARRNTTERGVAWIRS
jgi:hypothetical protein